jgi:hypothetical protein
MAERGYRGRLGKATAAERIPSAPTSVGGRALFCLNLHNSRISKDYERLCLTSETFVYAAMMSLRVGRLARAR